MITINDHHHETKPASTYRIRKEAEHAAIATLGPQAIRGFDFVTYQRDDGRWDWEVPNADHRPAPSPAIIKASGGKKSLLAMATAITTGNPIAPIEAKPLAEAAKPAKLPVPPRRMSPQAPGKPASASGGESGAGQRPDPKNAPAASPAPSDDLGREPQPLEQPFADMDDCSVPDTKLPDAATDTAAKSSGVDSASPEGPQSAPEGGENKEDDNMSSTQVRTKHDDGIPPFLRRTSTAQEKETVRKRLAKQVGPGRHIKNPPDAAAKRAEKREAAEAKFEGSPAHGRAKERAKKAAAATPAPKAAKRAIEPRKKAGASEGLTKGIIIKGLLMRKEGCTTADLLSATGWPSITVPGQARKLGLKLRKEKEGIVTRYYGR